MDPSFSDSRECKLIKDMLVHCEAYDAEGFTQVRARARRRSERCGRARASAGCLRRSARRAVASLHAARARAALVSPRLALSIVVFKIRAVYIVSGCV
jgi:hypothetical protein